MRVREGGEACWKHLLGPFNNGRILRTLPRARNRGDDKHKSDKECNTTVFRAGTPPAMSKKKKNVEGVMKKRRRNDESSNKTLTCYFSGSFRRDPTGLSANPTKLLIVQGMGAENKNENNRKTLTPG